MQGGGPGVVVKAAWLECRGLANSSPALGFRFQRNTCFFPAHVQRLGNVGSVRDREVACHLTILRRFS